MLAFVPFQDLLISDIRQKIVYSLSQFIIIIIIIIDIIIIIVIIIKIPNFSYFSALISSAFSW